MAQTQPTTIVGTNIGTGKRVAIVAGRFNEFIVDSLVKGALDTLVRQGVKPAQITQVQVPGCYELPLASQRLARSGKFDAIIALGVVIRGATSHYDFVAGECASGLARVSLQEDLPVSFGVLTTENIEQAIERAGTKAGNKGADAAFTALEMLNLLEQL